MLGSKNEFSVFLDISSSSVTLALIEHTALDYTTLWHHRERFLIIDDTSEKAYFTKIVRALTAVFAALEQEGFTKMPSGKGRAISHANLIIGAPWSYTIVRSNTLKRNEPFIATEKLVRKFAKETDERVVEDLKNGVFELGSGLELRNAETISTALNGYLVKDPYEKSASSLELVRLLGLYDTQIIAHVQTLCDKYIPSATLTTETNMQVLYEFIVNTLFLTDLTVFDVSGEVIELAIIEDGAFKNASYIISGLHALVRDICNKTSLQSEDVLAALKGGSEGVVQQFGADAGVITDVLATHTAVMADTLRKLLVDVRHPEHLFIRTAPGYESLYTTLIQNALDQIEDREYALHVFSPKLLKKATVTEAKTNVAAFVFHNFKRD